MKLLIAEDDFTTCAMLEKALNKWGYEVITVSDGLAALKAMQKQDAPQLAILDWMMPGMDGPDLCKELRQQERQAPLYLILLTAMDQRSDIIKGLEAGADDYITKPYDKEELRARIYVGRRMINLQNELTKKEKLQGVLEMAGAVCHELNQPLQIVSGYAELLLMDIQADDPNKKLLTNIKSGIERIGNLTRKIMAITHYKSKPYLKDGKIVDINNAS